LLHFFRVKVHPLKKFLFLSHIIFDQQPKKKKNSSVLNRQFRRQGLKSEMLRILLFWSLLLCQMAADTVPDYSNFLLKKHAETIDDDEAENSLWNEKDAIIYNG
jgi:hypothetical protein